MARQARATLNTSFSNIKDAGELAARLEQFKAELLHLLNSQQNAIIVGPEETLPEGLNPGQPVIQWDESSSEIRVWNGASYS